MWVRVGVVLALVALAGLWVHGHWTEILAWTSTTQRAFQNAMASGLRAVQSGNPVAILSLCGATFAYGFVHALGPGHGKIILGATAMASGATLRRMLVLSLASAMAQSLAAVLLVGGLIGGLAVLSSQDAIAMAEGWLQPLSYGLFAAIGAVIVWRGLRILHGLRPAAVAAVSCGCGHAHGPSLEEVETLGSARDAMAVILSVAVRPCTGALLLLVIAARLEIFWVGIAGTFAMGLGTAAFNGLVALSGVLARRLAQSGETRSLQATMGLLHTVGGAAIAGISLAFLLPSL